MAWMEYIYAMGAGWLTACCPPLVGTGAGTHAPLRTVLLGCAHQDKGLPVIAANAPRRYVSMVRAVSSFPIPAVPR